ncbi:BRCA1-associated RING domain protein 1-like, partial [Harpegnathos saltator]|uniref:BRCA1-associated RING domain protein 1-like n=1 Tax=Harpegnathos saltator TaxID=610380 RepID=UPI000DBEF1E9
MAQNGVIPTIWISLITFWKPSIINSYILDDYNFLHAAADEGNEERVRRLIALGANINIWDKSGYTPLAYGCTHGHVNVVCALLQLNADIEYVTKTGYTPLMIAVYHGHITIVKILLEH